MRIDERVRAMLAATTRFRDLRFLDSVDSTNRYGRDAALAGTPEGLVVVADHQLAGRGRIGRAWEASPGSALLLSVLLRPRDLEPGRLHLVTAAVGLAAAAALRRVAGVEVDLKWPNDLLVGERKLAGILAEAIDVRSSPPSGGGDPGGNPGGGPPGLEVEGPPVGVGAVVVGIGINVSAAPVGAVGLEEAAGRSVARVDVLVALLEELEARYGRWDAVAAEYRATCATVGRRVRVEGPVGSFRTGTASGIDADGRLVVADEATGTEVALSVGDVVHLRPAAPR
jgi:BirA family biotin operon repressor/biotin-[acetyl-CoA-carboxylase] ligase